MASATPSPTPVKDNDTVLRLDHMIQQLNSLSTSDSSLAPRPFTGSSTDVEHVNSWLRYFDNYARYRQLDGTAALNLFKLLMKDLAADWLAQVPMHMANNMDGLRGAFTERFALNPVQRLQRATSMWQRNQGTNETVDEYINAMRKLAQQSASHDERQLVYAVVRGLKDKIRLQVLNSGADTLAQVQDAAKRAEAALVLAPDSSEQSVVELSKAVAMLVEKLATKEATTSAVTDSSASTQVNAISARHIPATATYNRGQPQGERRIYNRPTRSQQRPSPRYNNYAGNNFRFSCRNCATSHRNGVCPAKGQSCYQCNRFGHFAKCCRSTGSVSQQQYSMPYQH
jgi:Retrotransposon gag protein